MLKQSSSKMKKVLSILLAVLFVVSLTAVAASAYGGGHGRGWGDGGYGGVYGLGGDGWDAGSPFPPYYPYAGPQVIAIDYRYYNQPGIWVYRNPLHIIIHIFYRGCRFIPNFFFAGILFKAFPRIYVFGLIFNLLVHYYLISKKAPSILKNNLATFNIIKW
jgi:hypothetical protein